MNRKPIVLDVKVAVGGVVSLVVLIVGLVRGDALPSNILSSILLLIVLIYFGRRYRHAKKRGALSSKTSFDDTPPSVD